MRAPFCSDDPTELLSLAVIEDPHPFFERVREAHPVSRVGDSGVHLVADWKNILEALDREEDFSANLTGVLLRDAEGQPSIFELPPNDGTQVIATADEPRHAVHRHSVKPRLTEARVSAMEPAIRRIAQEAVATWLDNGAGDFIPVAEMVPAKVIGQLLGLPDGDAERHRNWAMVGGEMLAGDVDLPRMLNLAEQNAGMTEYLGEHLENAAAGTAAPDEASLLQLLAAAIREGTISRSEAIGISLVMFGAGGESTSALLGSAVRLLAADPSLAGHLRENPEVISRFVEEAVRMEPPFKFHYRVVRRTCELAGFDLQPGDRLMLLWAAANRDPAVFEDPNELRLNRKHPKHHVSFGRGSHFCVGAQLARLEVRLVIEELLGRSAQISLDPKRPPVHARSIFTRRLESLPLVAQ